MRKSATAAYLLSAQLSTDSDLKPATWVCPILGTKVSSLRKKLQYRLEKMTKNGIPAIVSLAFNIIL